MKKFLLFSLLFACGISFAQVGDSPQGTDQDGPAQAFTDFDFDGGNSNLSNMPVKPDRSVEIESGTNSRMVDITFYINRTAFEAEACDLVNEDFEGSNCGFICGCGGPFNSNGNGCYSPAVLVPGFSLANTSGAGTVVLTGGALGSNGTTIVGANTFTSNTVMDFDPPVGSVGFDIAGTFFGTGTYSVSAFGASGLIGTSTVQTNNFIGFIADEEITQVTVSTLSGFNGELFDDLAFGPICAGGGNHCDPSDCLIVTCPPDVTVDCIENYVIDAANADAIFNCTGMTGGGQVATFDYTGDVQTWTVPAGVDVITINAFGAQGGANINGTAMGGNGGDASGTLTVTPGEVLNIYVGGMGTLAGGFNGGANSGSSVCTTAQGGGGGGASDVRQGGSALSDRVIVAAGGGGGGGDRQLFCGPGSGGGGAGGYYGGGGGGGWNGGSGLGGTQASGGAGGAGFFGGGNGASGTLGAGGNGGFTPASNQGGNNVGPPGGSGGGLNGVNGGIGSPGWRGGGGGGGSSYIGGVLAGETNNGTNSGDGLIEIVYGSGGGTTTGVEAFRYVDQPQAIGAANCPGTVYEIVYHVGDDLGNVGCCVQLVTIDNAPPTITVTPGETVNCYEDIPVITGPVTSEDGTITGDATVTTSCGNVYDLKILPPVVEGVHECPGTTYTYGYRVRDNCGREVIANRVFTIGNNDAPSIVAPPDMTVTCDFYFNLNPDYAEVTTGCTLGYTTSVSGPSVSGQANCNNATYTYTYTVTDDCGRSASDIRKFTIANDAPTFLNCPDVPLQLNCEDEGWENVIQAWLGSIQAESSCLDALTVNNNYNPFTQGLCISNGPKKVTFFTTDACGRTSTCVGTILITDTEGPVFVEPPQDELVVCNYITQDKLDAWVDAHGNAEVEDCWTINDNMWSTFPNNPTINCSDQMPTSITVTFVATDGCGNKSSMDATFTALPGMGGMAGSEGDEAADNLQLFQNQPNPFKDATTISFYLPQATEATISIYDLSGKLLKQIEGDYDEGMNVEEINRSDLQGVGVLYYKLSTATETATLKMILLD